MASGMGKLRQIADHNGQAIDSQIWKVARAESPVCLAMGDKLMLDLAPRWSFLPWHVAV